MNAEQCLSMNESLISGSNLGKILNRAQLVEDLLPNSSSSEITLMRRVYFEIGIVDTREVLQASVVLPSRNYLLIYSKEYFFQFSSEFWRMAAIIFSKIHCITYFHSMENEEIY